MDSVMAQVVPLPWTPVLRRLTVQMLRDGEQTVTPKIARLVSDDLTTLMAVFVGEHEVTQFFDAAAVSGEWLLLGADYGTPRRAAARLVPLTADLTLTLDMADGSGGGGGGQPATVAARVRLAQQPASRPLVVVGRAIDGAWQVLGSGQSDAAGNAALELRVPPSVAAYAVAIDNWGVPFQAGLAVDDGVVVRPSQFAGWLYQVTEAGTLPASEPVWWPAEGDNAPRQLGTARAVAVRYYQPLAHGPVPVEVL